MPSQADIFGTESVAENLAEGVYPHLTNHYSLVNNYAFEVLLVGIFLLFCYLIYNFRGSILLLARMLVLRITPEKVFEEQTLFFKQFMTLCSLLGVLVVTGFIVKVGDGMGLDRFLPATSPLIYHGAVLAVLVAVGVIWVYKYLLLKLIGGITRSGDFFRQHGFLTHLYGAVVYLILTPLLLMFSFGSERESRVLFWIILGLLALVGLLYLSKSYRFFVERKVSTLQWILYLCAVEIFPVSLFVLAGLRQA